MSDWFGSWFDSKYYHILYKNRDLKEAETFIKNITSFIQLKPGAKVLDLACGKGRHSIFLNKLGYDVTGLDLSANSIEHATQFSNEKLNFGTHDMRQLIPHSPYDTIINAFTSFGYFNNPKDDILTLTNVKNALAENGVFIFDFMNVDAVIENLVSEESKTIEGVDFELKRYVENKSIFKEIKFSAEGKSHHFTERVDALTLQDFRLYFDQVGLKITHLFGDYQLNSFDSKTSKRLIIVAQN